MIEKRFTLSKDFATHCNLILKPGRNEEAYVLELRRSCMLCGVQYCVLVVVFRQVLYYWLCGSHLNLRKLQFYQNWCLRLLHLIIVYSALLFLYFLWSLSLCNVLKTQSLMKTQKLEWSFVCWFLHAIGVWSTYGACIIYRENHHSVPPSDGFVLSSVCIIAFYNQTAEYKFLSWCNILTESHSYNWLSLWSKQ